jgi:hypothetical protein
MRSHLKIVKVKTVKVIGVCALVTLMVTVAAASASDQVYFSSTTNVTNILVNAINAETVRLDISTWYLSEHAISIAIASRFAAGVPVRIIGDRAAPFENDPHTKMEYYWLASQGVPIRLRYNPTYFPEINHWKMALFVGQNMVEFGSGNFAPTELAPNSATDYDDDSEMFTTDPVLVNAFKTKFDVMWNDTTVEPQSIFGPPPYLKDWNDACTNEPTGNCADYATLYPNPKPMVINTARLEADNPMPPDLIWGQGSGFNNRLTQEINNENTFVDLVVYRLEVDNITQALLARKSAGVPVKVIVDPAQYVNSKWPEFWLTHANVDKLYAAGVPLLQRVHSGVTHLKTLITSAYATNASSNFSPAWQRDHDYFVSAATKPAIYQAFLTDFNSMWSDATNFGPFTPTPPAAADLSNPASGAIGVSTTVSLVWNRATWATSYDVYLGTSAANMALVANVPALLSTDPPLTYSWTTGAALQAGTTYFWKVVSKTFATPVNPSMVASSVTQSFTTATGPPVPPSAPASPSPAAGATGVPTASTLSWTSAGATSYDVKFGTTNPPPQVTTGQAAASYAPSLAASTAYFWQIVAHNSVGATTGPVWSFTTAAPGGGLPAPWVSQDVGATGLAGSASFAGGVFTVNGSGADIWGNADAFQYVYQPLTGDGQIVARVAGVQNTNMFAKAGVMLRETTAAGAAHVILDVRPDGSIEFMTRLTTGGATTYIGGATQAPPAWLKLVRTGTTVTGSVSPNGTAWTTVGSTSVTMASTALAGLIVTSHDTSQTNTSTFDNVAVTPAAPPPPPAAPGSPSPASGAAGVATNSTLSWTAAGATSYDVKFGTSSPPPPVTTGQAAASYAPALAVSTTYFWQIIAHNSGGATSGAIWSFSTAAAPPPPPSLPASPAPADGATGVATNATLTWSAAGATSYDVKFGTTNTPPQVTTGQAAASYTPALAAGTAYFWQIVAHNSGGATTGPVWSFTTAAGGGGLPSPWLSQDVGATGLAGSASFAGGVFTVKGSGADIWGSADAFQYVYQPLTGDGQIIARVTGVQNTSTFAKAGVMLRETTAAGAVHVILDLRPDGSIEFMTRQTTGGATTYLSGATQAPPAWLKLVRTGTTVTGYASTDGTVWATVGTTGVTMSSTALIGLIVTSHDTTQTNTSTFDNVAVTAAAPPPPPAAPGSPSPAAGATGVATTSTLSWSAAGATSYDVKFGTSSPPPQVTTGQAAASYAPPLTAGTTYFWQIVAHNSGGVTTGAIWSFTTAAPPPPPAAPGSPSPASGAIGVATSSTLSWSAAGATSYDVRFGTSSPPPQVVTGQAAASYVPALSPSTTYFWQIIAHNSGGITSGAIWSFTTAAAPAPPAAPGSPSPAAGATGVATTSTLSWSAAGATSFDVSFGTSSPPPQVAAGQAAASYAPALAAGTTYFWQIVAHNSAGATTGPVWSFATAAAPPGPANIVVYASDIAPAAMHGMWSAASDPTSPNGTKLVTPDNGLAWTSNPPAPPIHYVDVTFTASAGVPYTFWLRMQALGNSKFNDSVWVQFSDAQVNGATIYPMNSTSALDVNLATDSTGSSNSGWGWDNAAYWLTQPATVTFPASGTHTLRIQVREDGVQFDQIVLSPTTYLNAPPGPRSNDSTIVPKP